MNITTMILGSLLLLAGLVASVDATERIGVLYAVHGGAETWGPQASWDSSVQIFSYDPNSFVYKNVIWNPGFWGFLLFEESGKAQSLKYDFEYPRLGGYDPYNSITDQQLADMTTALAEQLGDDYELFTGRMGWIGDDPTELPNPRGIYFPQVAGGVPVTYCGGPTDGGPWPGCDPQCYNVDGAVERILANAVDRIIIVDTTTTGVRFFKTFDQLRETQKVVDAYNTAEGKSVTVEWVNDPTGLLLESYPTQPTGWTASLGPPQVDSEVPLQGRPNPFVEDSGLAELYVKGVKASIRDDIPYAKQAVILMNHHVRANNQYFDPKIDDTLVLNENIRQALLRAFPGLIQKDMLGAWFGRKEVNPEIVLGLPSFSQLERTRFMRGENLGEAYLYETDEELPSGIDGYLYWEALEELKNTNRIEHIVVVFPQIFADSVLSLVEVHNQVAKEIGFKNWLYWEDKDYDTYPSIGHPFIDYWGNWANVECFVPGSTTEKEPCCFEMGGCSGTSQPYPPERQSPANESISVLDPNLAYHVSEYGHLGYDPALGSPSAEGPVQDQYDGTWALWKPPSDDPAAGNYIARKVYEHITG